LFKLIARVNIGQIKLLNKIFHKMKKKVNKMDFSEIPMDSSLGLLAFGDLAFTAWRRIKKESQKKDNDKK